MLTADELRQIARAREGSLEEVPFAVLLHAMATSERAATLELRRRQLCKEIVIEDGIPVDCRSNLVHETLSRFMVSIGRIDQETFNTCFSESCAREVPFGDVLIDKGIIDAEELLKILQQNLARKLLDGFSWREGTFVVRSDLPDVITPLKVNVGQLIIIGVTRFATQQQIDSSIGPLIGKPLALNPDPHYRLEEIRFSGEQRKMLDALRERSMRIDELAGLGGLPSERLSRLLYALTLTGIIGPADRVKREARPAQPPAVKKAAASEAPDGRPVAERGVSEELRSDLMKLVLNYRRKDAFELLSVQTTASISEIQEAYIAFARRYAPWRFDSALADRARDVFLGAARAYSELMDPERRQALVERRQRPEKKKKEKEAAPDRDRFRIHTTLLDPEIQFRRGKTLMNAGEYEKAIVQLEFAADLDSQNAVYRAELAYCRYLSAPTTGAPRALADLNETMRIDPRCGLAMFYAGDIYRRLGRMDEAEGLLQRAIKPMAPDRRPIEALRLLKRNRKG
jgi:hypothetical protein